MSSNRVCNVFHSFIYSFVRLFVIFRIKWKIFTLPSNMRQDIFQFYHFYKFIYIHSFIFLPIHHLFYSLILSFVHFFFCEIQFTIQISWFLISFWFFQIIFSDWKLQWSSSSCGLWNQVNMIFYLFLFYTFLCSIYVNLVFVCTYICTYF